MKSYIVKIAGKLEIKCKSLKEARKTVQSVLNANEIKGIEEVIEIYNETIKRKKIDQVKSDPKKAGSIARIYA